MHSFVINLATAAARWDFMCRQFEHLGMPFSRVDAVTAAEAEKSDVGFVAAPGMKITATERAILLSHRRAWALFLESGAPAAAIFEDDAHLTVNADRLLGRASLPLSGPWICRFETNQKTVRLSRARKRVGGFDLAGLAEGAMGSGGYVISREAVTVLLGRAPELRPIDNQLFDGYPPEPVTRLYQTNPAFIIQDDQRETAARFQSQVVERSHSDGPLPFSLIQRVRRRWKQQVLVPLTTEPPRRINLAALLIFD